MEEIKRKLNAWAYYIITALISAIALIVPPICIGGVQGNVGVYFPSDASGWTLWGISNGSIVIINLCILTLFKLQAKRNCENDPSYIKANGILGNLKGKGKDSRPRSPLQINSHDYVTKGVSLVMTSIASFIAIGSIVLNFDAMAFLSAMISVISAICMSWVTMIRNEEYWRNEYLLYAEWKKGEYENGERENRAEEPSAAGREE